VFVLGLRVFQLSILTFRRAKAKLLAVAKQPVKDVLVVIQDTGMRPEEVFRIRIENLLWSHRLMFNPNGKTKAARRHCDIDIRRTIGRPHKLE
jgi:integrase